MRKQKLIITEEVSEHKNTYSVVATVTHDELSYAYKATKTKIKYNSSMVEIKKTGAVSLNFIHRINERKNCDYKINFNGEIVSGNSLIETTKIETNETEILIEYLLDEQKVRLQIKRD